MTSRELVSKTIRGENPGRTPVYGWLFQNLAEPLTRAFGSVEAFEDHYQFDMAHLFGGPYPFDEEVLAKLRASGELTPEAVLEIPFLPVDRTADYDGILRGLAHHQKERGRFCYVQTNGIFEPVNDIFGIEEQLCNLLLYPEEMAELYRRLCDWNLKFIDHVTELGVDMVHISDDWGAQRSLLFSPAVLETMIFPHHKRMTDRVKQAGRFVSLHSDGCVAEALPLIARLGYDVLHPWQETAGMDYALYLERYADTFGILGGLCIQSALGFGDYTRLESEIRRVFSLLRGKRWMFCTTHFVQDHCSIEELCFAYDLAVKLARN